MLCVLAAILLLAFTGCGSGEYTVERVPGSKTDYCANGGRVVPASPDTYRCTFNTWFTFAANAVVAECLDREECNQKCEEIRNKR